jgi:hypothetical protein
MIAMGGGLNAKPKENGMAIQLRTVICGFPRAGLCGDNLAV